MAYSSSPSTVSGGAELWETDLDEVFVFRGDYREHMHLEDPTKPLYNGQLSLPSLPVTPLKESCEVYLRSVRALATDEEYAKTKQSVGEFVKPGGKGEVLQRRLEQRARDYGDSSWLQHWWNAGSYLEFRMANVINVSYFFSFADLPAGFRGKQVLRASLLAHGALKFRQAVCRGDDVNAGKIPGSIGPGCATPYKYMFNACRIPLPGSDKGLHYSPHVPEYQKIVVIRKGQFFTFQACEGAAGGWEPYGPKRLATQLSAVLKMAENSADYPPVGAMAGADRDAWSAARARMSADAGNREFLDAVQSAIFCVCLDDTAPVTRTDTGRALWHGDSRQRWYDKSIQIIVFENGKAGLMGEHSNYDGMPAVGLSDFILNHEREVLARYEEGAPGNPQLGRGGGGGGKHRPHGRVERGDPPPEHQPASEPVQGKRLGLGERDRGVQPAHREARPASVPLPRGREHEDQVVGVQPGRVRPDVHPAGVQTNVRGVPCDVRALFDATVPPRSDRDGAVGLHRVPGVRGGDGRS